MLTHFHGVQLEKSLLSPALSLRMVLCLCFAPGSTRKSGFVERGQGGHTV